MSQQAERPRGRARAAPPAAPRSSRGHAQPLIESRLTPNAISMTGLVGNVVAAVLVWERYFFLAGIAFIVGSIMDTLDGRYSRMSGKGTPFGAFLDSTLDRMEEGIVLMAVGGYFARPGRRAGRRGDGRRGAVLADGLLHPRPRRGARASSARSASPRRPVRVVILSIGLLFAKGAGLGDFELLGAVRLRARRPHPRHHLPAHRARPHAAQRRRAPVAAGRARRCNPRHGAGLALARLPQEEPDHREQDQRKRRDRRAAPTAPPATRRTRSASPSSASATAPRPSSRASSTTRTPTRPSASRASCTSTSAATTSATSSSRPPSTSTSRRSARTSPRRSGPARTTR